MKNPESSLLLNGIDENLLMSNLALQSSFKRIEGESFSSSISDHTDYGDSYTDYSDNWYVDCPGE